MIPENPRFYEGPYIHERQRDPASPPIIKAGNVLEYYRAEGQVPDIHLDGVVLAYQSRLVRHVQNLPDVKEYECFEKPLFVREKDGLNIGMVGRFGIGPSVSVNRIEEFKAFGIDSVISIGTAGAIDPDLKPGDIVVCKQAVIDDSVTKKYIGKNRDFVYPSHYITEVLHNILSGKTEHIKRTSNPGISIWGGPTWTTDVFYRETVEDVMFFQDLGVLTVEMEAAPLMAASTFLSVNFATAFVISDSIADYTWKSYLYDPRVSEGLIMLYEAANEALVKFKQMKPDDFTRL